MGADFRSQGNKAIFGGNPACRPKAITVQQTAGVTSIGKYDARRAIPGLHMHGVVLIKRLEVRVDTLDVLPCRRNQHAKGPRQLHPARGQQFKHIIEARGIRTRPIYQRGHRLQIRQQR